ncbi:hypothetical protein BDW22DRAFT_1485224 [Trametopsis cervina]|nr:hypothetical protein BDW22DRAFT_1485224 [Trametopsis cervina]
MLGRKASRRCRWYNDDGTSRKRQNGALGCPRDNCMFAHPTDPEWKTATPSNPPMGYDPRNRDRDWEYQSYTSPDKDRAGQSSTSTSHFGSSSALAERKSSASSVRPTSPDSVRSKTDKRDRRPSPPRRTSTASDITERPRTASSSSMTRVTPTTGTKDKMQKDKEGSVKIGKSTYDGKGEEERRGSTSNVAVRALPSKAAPTSTESMPPPSISVARPEAPKKTSDKKIPDVVRNDKMDGWVSRIRVMADAVNARVDYVKIESSIASLRRLVNSRQRLDLSTETKGRMVKQITEAEARLKAKREELNTFVYRLIDSDFWPIPPRPLSGDADHIETQEEKFREVRVTVLALRDQVKELSASLLNQGTPVEVAERKPSPKVPMPVHSDQDNDGMVVDDPRPTKRRRLSEEPQRPAESNVQPSASQADLDALSDRLSAMETKIADLENDMVQYDQELSANVDDRLEEKLAALELSRPADPQVIDTGQISEETQVKLRALESEFELAGKDIEEMAKEVGGIIRHLNEVDDATARFKAENESIKQEVALLEQRQRVTEDMLRAQNAEIKALNAALTAYIARPPDPVPPPILPDIQTMVDTLRPMLIAAVREDISPMLLKLRQEVETILSGHTAELSGTVMAHLRTVLKMQETIQAFLIEQKNGVLSPANGDASHDHGPLNGLTGVNGTILQNRTNNGQTNKPGAPS